MSLVELLQSAIREIERLEAEVVAMRVAYRPVTDRAITCKCGANILLPLSDEGQP